MKQKSSSFYEFMIVVLILAAILLPQLENDAEIRLMFEYREENGGTVSMEAVYKGEDKDPLEEADPISLKLIQNACPGLTRHYSDGTCTLKGNIA